MVKLKLLLRAQFIRGFKTLVTDIMGNILFCDGYNSAEIAFFRRFLENNRKNIELESKENA